MHRSGSNRILPRKLKHRNACEYALSCDHLSAYKFCGQGILIYQSSCRSVIITQKEIGKLSTMHSLLKFTKIVLECERREEV